MPRKILVTSALPYANGPLHLGHILESVQTDIWVRFQRMRGHQCLYCCAEDAHGTPIMIRAQSEGITPETLITRSAAEHLAAYQGFLVAHDQFHTTHSAENTHWSSELYRRLLAAGHISARSVRQAYDEKAAMFLPDRYIKGGCPRCKSPDQYGDSCEVCGATYNPADLIDPRSTITNTPPVWRESEHLFFQLGHFEAMLRQYMSSHSLQPAVQAKLAEWFDSGLKDWDISRDKPYFGIEIPDHPGKYFYVWFDAPIGYIASFDAWRKVHGGSFDDYWVSEAATELYHFIGKDIQYFHTLFWPAVLHGAGLRRPSGVFVHGFLTINGQKMSKTRGTFITAEQYLKLLPAEPLRYYFAAKLADGVDDIDFNLDDFVARTNADLIGKLVNIASRCAPFVARSGGHLADALPDAALYQRFVAQAEPIAALYESRQYAAAIRSIMELADEANRYIDAHKPWILAKDPARADEVRAVATQALNLFRVLMSYLTPVLPRMAVAAGELLGVSFEDWNAIGRPLLAQPLQPYQALATRLDPALVAKLVTAPPTDNASAAKSAPAAKAKNTGGTTGTSGTPGATASPAAALATAAVATGAAATPTVATIDDFARLDLRAARVLAASTVDGSDKLLRLNLDLGSEQRVVFSGIRASYQPEELVGRMVVVIYNLAPRKMRFGVSQGMVLCAGPADDKGRVYLLSVDAGVEPGMRIS